MWKWIEQSAIQVLVHLLECLTCLLEEVEDNALAELPLCRILIHLQDLLERGTIDVTTAIDLCIGKDRQHAMQL